jgi:hypothetical protein
MTEVERLVQEFAEYIEGDYYLWSPEELRAVIREFANNILSGDQGEHP